jgi:WD40 repeat protein
MYAGSEAKVWDPTTGQLLRTFDENGRPFPLLAFSPDGTRLASRDWDNDSVTVWEASSGRMLRTLKGHPDAASEFMSNVDNRPFSADGTRLALRCKDGTVKVWDVVTGQQLCTVNGHRCRLDRTNFGNPRLVRVPSVP